jgi:hypothetical protein
MFGYFLSKAALLVLTGVSMLVYAILYTFKRDHLAMFVMIFGSATLLFFVVVWITHVFVSINVFDLIRTWVLR